MFASLSLVLLLAAWPFGKGGGQKGWGEGALCSRKLLSAGTLRWWEGREVRGCYILGCCVGGTVVRISLIQTSPRQFFPDEKVFCVNYQVSMIKSDFGRIRDIAVRKLGS